MITSAYQVKAYEQLGIEVSSLGCIMLEFQQVPIRDYLPEEWAYFAKNPKYDWIKGLDVQSHVTLLYGLLEKGFVWKEYVDEVLEGWAVTIRDMNIREVIDFPPAPGEDYACLVGIVESWGVLEQAHKLLSFLPHVNTYPEYKPHLTLGYVKSKYKDEALRRLHQGRIAGLQLQPTELSYGDKHL